MRYFVEQTILEPTDLNPYTNLIVKLYILTDMKFQSAAHRFGLTHTNSGNTYHKFVENIMQKEC